MGIKSPVYLCVCVCVCVCVCIQTHVYNHTYVHVCLLLYISHVHIIETLYSSIFCQSKTWKQSGCPLTEECSDADGLFYYEVG